MAITNNQVLFAKAIRISSKLFLVSGIVLFGVFVYATIQTLRATSWPETTGIITQAKIESRYSDGNRQSLRLDIQFRYSVGDTSFVGSRIAFGHFPFRWQYRELLSRYAEGSGHSVHYDPSNPSTSTLEIGLHMGLIILLPMSLLFFGGGWYAFTWSRNVT